MESGKTSVLGCCNLREGAEQRHEVAEGGIFENGPRMGMAGHAVPGGM